MHVGFLATWGVKHIRGGSLYLEVVVVLLLCGLCEQEARHAPREFLNPIISCNIGPQILGSSHVCASSQILSMRLVLSSSSRPSFRIFQKFRINSHFVLAGFRLQHNK